MGEFTLNQLFNITKGKKIQQVDTDHPDKIRFIQIEDLRNDRNIKYCIKDEKYVYANKDDIIIAWDGANAGTVGYNLEGAVGSTLAVLKKKSNNINSFYIAKYLQSKSKYLRDNCTGATIPHISRKVLEDLVIPIPPIDVQGEIVNLLDKAESLIDKRKAQISLLSSLTQSMFIEMFGDPLTNEKKWTTVQLGDISELITKGESPKWQGFSYVHKGVRFITSENVLMGKLDITKDKFIPNEFYEKLKRSKLKEDDVLINLVGASIGRCAKVTADAVPANINQAVALIRIDCEKMLPEFLLQQLMTKTIQDRLASSKVEGARANISLKNLNELELILPNLNIQRDFTTFARKIENQMILLQEGLVNLMNNYNSLMQRAFKGEI